MNQKELESLCQRLKNNDPSLLELDLDYENLGSDDVILLAEALHQNKTVYSVSVQYSHIGFEGTKKLLQSLKGRGIRTHLLVKDNYSDAEYETLLKMVPNSEKQKDNEKEDEEISRQNVSFKSKSEKSRESK